MTLIVSVRVRHTRKTHDTECQCACVTESLRLECDTFNTLQDTVCVELSDTLTQHTHSTHTLNK